MKVCVIGTGYVGLVVGTCLAENGNNVICVDCDKEKLSKLEKGIIPIYEPSLEELIKSNIKEERLIFTNSIEYAVQNSDICFIAVGTPQDKSGEADLEQVLNVTKEIAKAMNGYKIIVEKSTVPVGTCDKLSEIIKKTTTFDFDIVSNPEFLKQGNAVDDFMKPDRIIIGSNSTKATKLMQELYSPFLRTGNPIILMDTKSAELTKYASNTFLAMKISFANQIANICEKTGADYDNVRKGMSFDKRIGTQFLFSGIGYGGSCFPKDVQALIKTCELNECDNSLLKAVKNINDNQSILFVNKILEKFNKNLKDKTIAIWGLAFKPKTNDMREAPSIKIINELLKLGAKIQAFDPKAMENAKTCFKNKITYSKNSYEALQDADCLLLLTEWSEFINPDFEKIKKIMKTPIIFDGRNQYNKERLNEFGFEYFRIGKR